MILRFFGLCAAGALVAICPCYAATLTAADEYYTTPENASLVAPSGGLLANDTTPNPPLEVFLVTAPSDGALEIPAADTIRGGPPGAFNGGFVYTPNLGSSGTDSFTFQIEDATDQLSNVATAYVDVTAPVPLPASIWLMLSGLGGIGTMVRKRKTV